MVKTPKDYPLRGANRNFLTASMFVEIWEQATIKAADVEPVFSLRGRPGFIDARQSFLDLRDPTGVRWAEVYLEGIEHLNRLMDSPWFKDAWESWQEDMARILQSEAIEKIRAISESGSPAAFQAAKWLATQEWNRRRGAGRPSKTEVRGALAREVEKTNQLNEDMARLTGGDRNALKVVK
jgi:hypothetical protein